MTDKIDHSTSNQYEIEQHDGGWYSLSTTLPAKQHHTVSGIASPSSRGPTTAAAPGRTGGHFCTHHWHQ
jgi:hypothetical protein